MTTTTTLEAICTSLAAFREHWDTSALVTAEEFAARGPRYWAEQILDATDDEWTDADHAYAGLVRHNPTATTPTHRIWEDSGAEKFIVADSDKAARAEAREWVADGSYSRGDDDLADESFFAHAYTRNLLTGDSYTDDVLVDLSPEEPVCLSDEDGSELEHDWRDDGAWSVHGTQMVHRSTCARCGLMRHQTTTTTAGQLPHEPAKTSYERKARA